MNTLTLDHAHSRARARESLATSLVVHLLLFLWLILSQPAAGELAGLTEITFVEESDPAGEPNAAPPVAREETKSAPVQDVALKASREAAEPEHYERALVRAENAPRPQSSHALTDLLDKRLDAMDKNATGSATRIAALVPPPRVGIPAPAGAPGPGSTPNGVPGALRRNGVPGGGGTSPVGLRRLEGNRPAVAPIMAAATVENPAAPAPAVSGGGGTGARKLAGANLVGPVADREVLHYRVPDYPDWAKRDGVEGSVTLYFLVLPDGRVKENVLVEKTSGFSDFDRRATEALLEWRFVALPGGPAANEQWGRITFNYRLSDAQ